MPYLILAFALTLGARLLVRGARDRSGVEPWLGAALVALGGGASLLAWGAQKGDMGIVRIALYILSMGAACFAVFTRLAFRPTPRATWWFVVGGVLALFAGLQDQLNELTMHSESSRPTMAFALSRGLVLAWAAVEALLFRRMYLRRARLGLTDPVVANRLLLYALWIVGFACLPLYLVVTILLNPEQPFSEWSQLQLTPVRVIGVICLLSIYLTFLPPQSYLGWVRRRGGGSK